MSGILIRNAWLCPQGAVRRAPMFADVLINAGHIEQIGRAGALSDRNIESVIDVEGRVVTTPLVNFHEHSYSRLAKGLPVTGPMGEFNEILESLWWKLDRALDLEMVRASAHMTALECLACGVSYVFDHHASPASAPGSLSVIAEVFERYGVRSVLCYETSDRNGPESFAAGIKENTDYARQAGGNHKAMLGLHAPFTLADASLAELRIILRQLGLGIHTHLAEAASEDQYSIRLFGKSAAQRLSDAGLLNEFSIAAHGVHLRAEDLALLAEAGTGLACCPDSNLNNAVGVLNLTHLPDALPLLAGTDGMHANVARTFKSMFLLYRHQGGSMDATFHWAARVQEWQREFVRRYWPDYPALQAGDRADLVIWDYVPPTPLHERNALGHFLYGVLESRPHSVIGAGQFRLREYLPVGIDILTVRAAIAEQGRRLYDRFSGMTS